MGSANQASVRVGRWHDHVNHVNAPKYMQHWLTDTGSLTARLIRHSSVFRVEKITQQPDRCWADEYATIKLARQSVAHTREVLLRCDEQPIVFAHTVLPLHSNATHWPLFRTLENKSLGSTLFNDPRVKRGALQYARLSTQHPAMIRAAALVKDHMDDQQIAAFGRGLFARRSLFYRRGGIMLVTELFLPTITDLAVTLANAEQEYIELQA